MIKKIAILAVSAIVLAGTSAFAQNNQSNQTSTLCAKQCAKGQKCMQAEKRANEFAGITLTADQQAKIDAVKAEMRKDCKNASSDIKKDCKKVEAKGAKMAKEGKDKAVRDERRVQMEAKRSQYLGKIKEILTPEQYVTYLENQALSSKGSKGKMSHKGNKDHKKDQKRNKSEKKNS